MDQALKQFTTTLLSKVPSAKANQRALGYPALIVDDKHQVAIDVIKLVGEFETNKTAKVRANRQAHFAEQGWNLIQLFEDELLQTDIVTSRCLNALGATPRRVYARHCVIVELTVPQARTFFRETHLQGPRGSLLTLGLEQDGELLSAIAIGAARFNRTVKYELIRFSSALDTVVVGGLSKLINQAVTRLDGGLISYADRRYGVGKAYLAAGFTAAGISAPCYWYYWPENNPRRYHRSAFQKHKLAERLGGQFDPNLTELENTRRAGWCRVFDAGNSIFILG